MDQPLEANDIWKHEKGTINQMTHTPFGQRTNEPTALPENPVLIHTKNFYPGRQSISTLIILHLLTNSLDIPLLPLPGPLPCATFPIVFVVVLLIPLPSLSPCFWFLTGLVIFPPSPGEEFRKRLCGVLAEGPGRPALFPLSCVGIFNFKAVLF